MRIGKTFCLLAVFLLLACTSGEEKKSITVNNLNDYTNYISQVTQGIISTRDDIRVVLTHPVQGWESGDELEDALLTSKPRVKGKLKTLDPRTISFSPEDGLDQDTEYLFTLNLGAIVDDIPKDRRLLTFGLKTIKQQFNVYSGPLQSRTKDLQYLEAQMRSADLMSLEMAKELIRVERDGKALPINFEEGIQESRQFVFRVDSILRLEEDSELLISWNGKKMGIESQGKNTVKIPGKNNFTVLDIRVEQNPQQHLLINFSDPLKKGQNFNGLIVLEGDDNPKYSVEGSTLKLYPSKDIKGTATLEFFEGIQNQEGYKTKLSLQQLVSFEQLKPQLKLLSNATILPSSNNLKINFETVNLLAVDVKVLKIYQSNIMQFLQGNKLNGAYNLRSVARPIAQKKISLQSNISDVDGKWKAHALDLSKLISPEVGAIYRVEFDFKPSYSAYSCNTDNFDTLDSSEENFDEAQEDSSWDGVENYYSNYYYNYDWNERENPCHTSYYYDKKVGLNVLATDIGVTVKKGVNKSYFVAVNDLLNTNPIAGAKVSFYNYQQQLIGSVTTDADGTSIFDSEKLAYFAKVESEGQVNYVKLNDGNVLSVSKFNVAGVELQKGLKGFLFAERGVWRPGDKVFLSFMLNDKANELPEDHPVTLTLFDPYNKKTYREVKTSGLNGFYNFNIATSENAPTGNWLAKVSVGGASFTKSLRIETIKPNRLKIKTDFGAEILSSQNPIKGTMEVKWLHGAIARNMKADITARFASQSTSFGSFPGYTFDDPTRRFSTEEQSVFDGRVDAQGEASFQLKPQLSSAAPGMLRASFITKVYETGGDFSTDVFSKSYSPFSTYVGLNVPKGDKTRGMLLTDTKHLFEVVTVDEQGVPRPVKDLRVTMHKVNWRWWWDTSEENLSNFSSSNYREKVFEERINTGTDGKGTFEFELKYPEWGRYLVRVEDENGGHASGKTIYIDWPGWAGKSRKNDPSAATMLVFSADKEKYNVSEKATVTFPSSEGGRALVTVENGSEVLESLWVETQNGETKFDLDIKDLYTPNVYVHISLLQPHANTLNDAPIRLYGVLPLSVEDPKTRLQPEIDLADVLRPEETVSLRVSERNGRTMTYSIAMVDEGLLDLTRFKTPDPWGGFYARQALGVKTWDIYDDVIGAFGGRIDQVFAIGGDGDLAGAKNQKANRFEPMVVHLGPFELKPGQTDSHDIRIPKYVGSVRTMLVASDLSSEAYGATEKTTPVRKPLMVLASLPRKITPGEKVTLPVTVFAMEKKVKNVTLRVRPDKSFNITGSSSQTLSFSEPDEKMAYFELTVSELQGIGKVVVEASGDGEKASFEVPIDVINPNPLTTEVQDFVLDPGSTRTIELETFGISGSNGVQAEFSTLPPMNFNGRMQYLIHYPHGCVEQITSAAFPQLYLSDIFNLDTSKQQEIQRNVEAAIRRLGNYQLVNGGFSYWPGASNPNDWGTSFAGHFLLEAERKGYVLPIGFKSSWVDYQSRLAKQWRSDGRYPDLAQAYRLYVLALSGNADIASMNRLRETSGLGLETRYRLAAAYGLIGQKRIALDLIGNSSPDFSLYKDHSKTYGSASRNRAMALETLILLKDKVRAQEMAKTLAADLNERRWMSTQTTSYCLLAMAKFAEMIGGKEISAELSVNGKTLNTTTEKTLAVSDLPIQQGRNQISLTNKGSNTLYLSLVSSGVLAVGQERTQQRNLSVGISYKGRDGSAVNISRLQQGTNFVAEISLTNTSSRPIENMALTEIFPSGWEIVNTRFTDFGNFAENKVSYTDLRDDRAMFYFDLKRNETRTFRLLLNASYPGRYYLPGIQAEGMYNNDYIARTSGSWVEVVR
ncbi:alpha-2-macroglobulin family protein [Poritiphilus flavus]|uniref:Alpha-2-macroglobulin family protein n=1 Tax=Poritiphilus flavus TaxID=2697053 RepID=A0A6L9ED04_9FLAO|nr:MG2 domain-containing protein [Poritiphilus flavus]NAS12511.1 hypothetical protein [Poritiphilus flavus]